MRKNCQRAMRAFNNGKAAKPAASIWTDGETVFSYGTAILTRAEGGSAGFGPWILNRTSYSVTTTIHQNALAAEYPAGIATTVVDGLRQGCTRGELLDAAAAKAEA